jgi:hypothetical protein
VAREIARFSDSFLTPTRLPPAARGACTSGGPPSLLSVRTSHSSPEIGKYLPVETSIAEPAEAEAASCTLYRLRCSRDLPSHPPPSATASHRLRARLSRPPRDPIDARERPGERYTANSRDAAPRRVPRISGPPVVSSSFPLLPLHFLHPDRCRTCLRRRSTLPSTEIFNLANRIPAAQQILPSAASRLRSSYLRLAQLQRRALTQHGARRRRRGVCG